MKYKLALLLWLTALGALLMGQSSRTVSDKLIVISGPDAITTAIDVSDPDIVTAISIGSNQILGDNGDRLLFAATDATLQWVVEGGETAVFLGSDGTGSNDTLFSSAGAGTITVGHGTLLGIELSTEGMDIDIDKNNANTVSLENSSTGSVVLDMRDYADTTDDDMAHISLSTNCTTTSTGAEDCDLTIQATEAGTAEIRILIDGDGVTQFINSDVTLSPDNSTTNVTPNNSVTDRTNHNQIIGIPKLSVTQSSGALPDGTATAEPFGPLAATCTPIAAGTEADDATNYVTGSTSYQYTAQATAADNDGFDCLTAGHAVNGTDSMGFWFMTDTALTAGTLDVSLLDAAAVEANADMPAVTVVNEWVWIEVDFASDCDATCADIDSYVLQVTAAGAATSEMDGTVIHMDSGAYWLDTAEVAIGDVLVGGVISVSAAPTAAGSANTPAKLVENTNYIVNYQSGADALVFLTDQSANYGTTLEALQ